MVNKLVLATESADSCCELVNKLVSATELAHSRCVGHAQWALTGDRLPDRHRVDAGSGDSVSS